MIVVDPRGLSISEWCDYTSDNLSAIVPVMKVRDDDGWRLWGSHALNTLRRGGVAIPDPYRFASFQEWAMRFNQLIARL